MEMIQVLQIRNLCADNLFHIYPVIENKVDNYVILLKLKLMIMHTVLKSDVLVIIHII